MNQGKYIFPIIKKPLGFLLGVFYYWPNIGPIHPGREEKVGREPTVAFRRSSRKKILFSATEFVLSLASHVLRKPTQT